MKNVKEATKGEEATTMKVSQGPQNTDEQEYYEAQYEQEQLLQQQQQQKSYAPTFDAWVSSGGGGKPWWYPKAETPEIIRLDKSKNLKAENRYKPEVQPHVYKKGTEPVDSAVFYITTLSEPEVEKQWFVSSKRLAKQIVERLNENLTELKIVKHGSDKNVYYNIDPTAEAILLQQQQQQQQQKTAQGQAA
jgi:hypothetical protein